MLYMKKEENISLGDKAICGLGVVVGITAVAAGSPHLIDLLKQVSPDSIFTQFNGMDMEIPIRGNIEPVITTTRNLGLMAVAFTGVRIALSNLSSK